MMLLLSCQDDMGQMEVSNMLSKTAFNQEHNAESKFRALSKSFAEILEDRRTIQELYGFIDDNSGEISLNISKLVAGDYSNQRKVPIPFDLHYSEPYHQKKWVQK